MAWYDNGSYHRACACSRQTEITSLGDCTHLVMNDDDDDDVVVDDDDVVVVDDDDD